MARRLQHHPRSLLLLCLETCTSYWSIQSEAQRFASISHDFYLYKLNYDVKQYKTPWPWIHSTSFLQLFFRFDCCRVEQCNDSCDKENVIGFVAKKIREYCCWIWLFVISVLDWWFNHLHNPPYFSIWVTAWGQFTDEHTCLGDGACICLCFNLRSVDSQRR